MLGIPYRVYQLQRMRQGREERQRAGHGNDMDGCNAPPLAPGQPSIPGEGGVLLHPIFPHYAWGLGSKLLASFAALVLMTGLILTLHTLKTSINLSTYRPAILTVLGIVFIIIGPVVACKIVLSAYDRRLARQQATLEQLRSGIHSSPSTGRQVFLRRLHFLVGGTPEAQPPSPRRQREASGAWFPDALPTYASALELSEDAGKHWMSKFFDYAKSPPPAYADSIEMQPLGPSADAAPPTYPGPPDAVQVVDEATETETEPPSTSSSVVNVAAPSTSSATTPSTSAVPPSTATSAEL